MNVTRRIKAARALKGFRSTAALAKELDAGLGDKTLREIESGKRPILERELREIAGACGVPYEFFTVDFDRLPELTDKPSVESTGEAIADYVIQRIATADGQTALAMSVDPLESDDELTLSERVRRLAQVARQLENDLADEAPPASDEDAAGGQSA